MIVEKWDRAYQEVGRLPAWFALLEGRDHVHFTDPKMSSDLGLKG